MIEEEIEPLTQEEQQEVFMRATGGFAHHYSEQIHYGMNDEALEQALVTSLGIFGGSGGPDRMSVSYQGSGLKIWGGWHVVNHVVEEPIFAGKQTIATARMIYDINNPDDTQMNLF